MHANDSESAPLHHADYSSLLPCLSVTSHSTNERPGSPHLPSSYFTVQIQHAWTVASEPLAAIPVGQASSHHEAYEKFLLALVLQTVLISEVTEISTFSSHLLQQACLICL